MGARDGNLSVKTHRARRMEGYEQEIRRSVLDEISHTLISDYLSQKDPNHCGYSE